MKQTFLNRYFDAAASEGSTGMILKAVGEFASQAKEQSKVIEGNFQKSLEAQNEANLKAMTAQKEALETEINNAKKEAKEARELAEEISKKAATSGFAGGATRVKSFGQEVNEVIGGTEWKSRWSNYKDNGKQKGFHFDLQAKAVGQMSAANLTGSYFSAQDVPGITTRPYEPVHLRDLLPVGQTANDTIRYVVDNGGEGGAGMVAAGALKPQVDRDLQKKDASVKKIATYFRIPEEMVEDIPYMQTFLTQIGVEEVMLVEDAQILFGDGTGENLTGVYTSATAFTQAAAGVAIVTAPNEFDVLAAAQTQLQVSKFSPSLAIMAPQDYYNMSRRKDTTNNYILLGGGNGLTPSVSGMRVLVQNQMTAGSFLIGDPRTTMIFDRAGTTIRVFEQDQDNAIRNLITVVIEKRLALVNYRPSAWVKGTFAAGITDLTS